MIDPLGRPWNGFAQRQMQPVKLRKQMIRKPSAFGQNFLIFQQLAAFQQTPQRVLAAPDVPAPVARPADLPLRHLGIIGTHEILILVRTDIPVRPLTGQHAIRALPKRLLQLRVPVVPAHARRADRQLAPELAAPVADARRVVHRLEKRALRLGQHLPHGRVRQHALLKKNARPALRHSPRCACPPAPAAEQHSLSDMPAWSTLPSPVFSARGTPSA